MASSSPSSSRSMQYCTHEKGVAGVDRSSDGRGGAGRDKSACFFTSEAIAAEAAAALRVVLRRFGSSSPPAPVRWAVLAVM